MNTYVYHWSMRPESGLTVDLRVTAQSVVIARRELHRFLIDHDGISWTVESVSRESRVVSHEPRNVDVRWQG